MAFANRREFLGQIGSAAIAIPTAFRSDAEVASLSAPRQSPTASRQASYDLLMAGGRVIDPSQNLSAERDVAIAGGKIARIAVNIPPSQARQVFDAKGKIVTPGLIDMHAHVFEGGIPLSLDADSDAIGFRSGVTTIVDPGSAGAANFRAFRKYVIDVARTRIYALLNISTIGITVTNEIYTDPKMIDAGAAIRTILANRDVILGVKVRVDGKRSELEHDVDVMKVAREVADAAELPIMLHWTVDPELLAMLKQGDILTHPFNVPGRVFPNVFGPGDAQAAKVLPQILALRDRGIWIDGQLGTIHHSWQVSEKAVAQGWFPDALSTDFTDGPDALRFPPPKGLEQIVGAARRGSVLIAMSQALHLGVPLEKVIACVTATPARMLPFPEKIGTLEPGVTANIAVLELAQGNFESPDEVRQTRTIKQQVLSVATVKGGIFLKGAPTAASV